MQKSLVSWKMKPGLGVVVMGLPVLWEAVSWLAEQGPSLGSLLSLGIFGTLGSVTVGRKKGPNRRELRRFRDALLFQLSQGVAQERSDTQLLEMLKNKMEEFLEFLRKIEPNGLDTHLVNIYTKIFQNRILLDPFKTQLVLAGELGMGQSSVADLERSFKV
ncbi:MAG TPA: hypothetical protein DF383_01610, partial [Deltaproteobacteria bacterium]|nr:hypothetical protein [Deltaproteobacteria bacterium]